MPAELPFREPPCLIAAAELQRRVAELAAQISADYRGRDLLVVGVLKGAFVFLADLVRALTIPVRCDFVKLSSYGLGTESSGAVRLQLDASLPVAGAEVLIVEDIIDTGTTTSWLIDHLRRQGAAGVKLCALLDKPARRRNSVSIDYLGFTIPDHF
ncbi:MAG: hypoxanthine phosphoribosyltransferase, partial [Planctomycetia bacterium]|nr:hypoxanthine phosphoribosyltransferase [Planctomycetia bacterium]